MAIVRELTTLLDFQVDQSSINKYEAAVGKVKSLALAAAGAFGLVFGAEKIYQLVDGLVDAGKEINKLTYQLTRMARPGDDINAAMDTLFQTAQATGVEYTHVLETYKEMLNESKELNVNQDQLTTTVDNIYKGLRLGAASSEEMSATFSSIERSFRMGRFGRRQFGMLEQQAPAVIDALAESLGKTRHELAEMAKEGKLTSEILIEGLGKPIASLTRDFANRPRKLAEGFMYAWNAASRLAATLWKMYNVNSRVANGIVWLTDVVSRSLERLAKGFGGIDRLIKLIGVTLLVVFGPKLIAMLDLVLARTIALIAANWVIVAQYAAWALAIAGIFLVLEDIMVWMRGGKSVMGDLLGPFSEFMDKLSKSFENSPFFAFIRGLKDVFQGDFAGAFKELGIALGDVNGILGTITTALIGIAAAFLFWNTGVAFWGLISNLLGIIPATVKLVGAVGEVAIALTGLNTISFAPLLAALAGIAATALFVAGAIAMGKSITDAEKNVPSAQQPQFRQNIAPGVQGPIPGSAPNYPITGSIFSIDRWRQFLGGTQTPNVVPPGAGGATPGAVQGPAKVDQTVAPTYNVTINGVANSEIAEQTANAIRGTIDTMARSLRSASPATEVPPS